MVSPGLPGSWRTATRDIPGISSLSNCSTTSRSCRIQRDVNPVALPPGRARLSTNPPRNGIGDRNKHNRQCACCLLQSQHSWICICEYYVWRKRGHFRCVFSDAIGISRPAVFDPRIAPDLPAKTLQTLQERSILACVSGSSAAKFTSTPMRRTRLGLLRARSHRPRSRAAEQGGELAAPHSITSSARNKNSRLIVSPSSRPVVRLRASSNLLGCSTGNSAGFAPLRILTT